MLARSSDRSTKTLEERLCTEIYTPGKSTMGVYGIVRKELVEFWRFGI